MPFLSNNNEQWTYTPKEKDEIFRQNKRRKKHGLGKDIDLNEWKRESEKKRV